MAKQDAMGYYGRPKCPKCNGEFLVFITDYFFRCIPCNEGFKIVAAYASEEVNEQQAFVRVILPAGDNKRTKD